MNDTASGDNPAGGDLIHRVYAAADKNEIPTTLAAEVVAALNSLRLKDAQIAALKAQLPPEMQHCTIRFVACKKGHGRLVGTDWTDYLADEGCLKCKLDALTPRLHKGPLREDGNHCESHECWCWESRYQVIVRGAPGALAEAVNAFMHQRGWVPVGGIFSRGESLWAQAIVRNV